MIGCAVLSLSSPSFSMDEMLARLDPNDPQYPVIKQWLEEQVHINPNFLKSSYSHFNHDPERVRQEKAKYTFAPLEWKVIDQNDPKLDVSMGQFQWANHESASILYTKEIQDCVGIVAIGPKVGLGHIANSPKDHLLLQESLNEIENPEKYTIALISHYYSDSLKQVYDFIKRKFPTSPLYADISNNVLDYGPDGVPSKFFYSAGENMQAQNYASREVYVHTTTGHITQ